MNPRHKDNELLREALQRQKNEEAISAYKDKKVAQEACEASWWVYIDKDSLYTSENDDAC